MGTIFNALIIAIMIDLCIKFVPTPSNYIHQLILAIISVITVGIGGGIYLVSNLGAGPRDGLMIGLQKLTKLPIAVVRAALEISAVSVGWYLGGTVGVGTIPQCITVLPKRTNSSVIECNIISPDGRLSRPAMITPSGRKVCSALA